MRKDYGCHSVRLCVCHQASCYTPGLYVEKKVPSGFIRHFQDMHCVDFVENA
jgi:hypothetical protein